MCECSRARACMCVCVWRGEEGCIMFIFHRYNYTLYTVSAPTGPGKILSSLYPTLFRAVSPVPSQALCVFCVQGVRHSVLGRYARTQYDLTGLYLYNRGLGVFVCLFIVDLIQSWLGYNRTGWLGIKKPSYLLNTVLLAV